MHILVSTANYTEINLVMTAVDQRLWLAVRQRMIQEIEVEKTESEPEEETE
jgi:hypothetical protein